MEPIKYTNRERLLHKTFKLKELRLKYPAKVPSSFMEIELNLIIDTLNIEVEILLEKINKLKNKLRIYKEIIDDIA